MFDVEAVTDADDVIVLVTLIVLVIEADGDLVLVTLRVGVRLRPGVHDTVDVAVDVGEIDCDVVIVAVIVLVTVGLTRPLLVTVTV